VTVTQLALVTATPEDIHADARRRIRDTIRDVARAHGGIVSPNCVRRALVPFGDMPRGVVGQVYRDLRRQGVLVPVGTERSDDVKGGNAGRLIETFRLVTA
jgi:hypothetical protein